MESSRDDVARLVIATVITTFRVKDAAQISEATTASDVNGWDSLSHTMLLMNIEDALGCELPLDQVYGAKNIGDLITIAANARQTS